eukprot:3402743-Karenia_brevis.AAC.1
MIEKHPRIKNIIQNIYDAYVDIDYPGTQCSQQALCSVKPTPLPGAAGRKIHKHVLPPCGPV